MTDTSGRILLLRHGINDYVKAHLLAGRTPGVHLNDEGTAEAAALAERLASLPIAAVYSSPLERACETAAPTAARLGLAVQLLEGMKETDCGEWTGRPLDELSKTDLWRQVQGCPSLFRFPGGESFVEIQARVVAALDGVRLAHPEQTVAVFSHADPIKVAVAFYLGTPLDLFQRIEVAPASITELVFASCRPTVARLNDCAHIGLTRILRRRHLELRLQTMTDHPTAFTALSYYDEDDVYPVSRITAAPVGDPRQRYFILQAHIGDEPVSWVIERDQARALSRQIPTLLTNIRSEFPELAEPLVAAEPNLTLTEPWQPLFRVGSLGIGYDRLHDLIVFTLVDADTLEAMADPETIEADDPEQLVFTTRGQALLLAQQAERVVAAGRPYCPRCDEPIFDFGHFCPPSNARKGRHNEYVH